MGRAPEIRTQRLLLRRWRERDLVPFAEMNRDPEVMRFMPALLGRDESDRLARRADGAFDADGFGLWAVEMPGRADFMGFVGLNPVSFEATFTPAVEIGWRLARRFWGKGYASEAAETALRFGFEDADLEEVVSFTAAGNVRSRAVMRRIGLRRDEAGDFEHPKLPEGHALGPHVLYRLARDDWYRTRGPAQGSGTAIPSGPSDQSRVEPLTRRANSARSARKV